MGLISKIELTSCPFYGGNLRDISEKKGSEIQEKIHIIDIADFIAV
ncbi:MAG: hypothetical protein R6U96_14505 [Promethearchaeia archaeon]